MLGDDRFNGVKTMRWKSAVVSLALAGTALTGCKQQIFMTECDLKCAGGALHAGLEGNPEASILPATDIGNMRAPATVNDPDRPIRYMTLAEAIAMAMEHGTIGSQNPSVDFGASILSDSLVTFSNRSVFGSDSIRAFALDPANTGADIDSSLAKFDTRWVSSLTYNNQDQPIGTALQNFQAGGNANSLRGIQSQQAALSTQLIKPLPSGGVAGITFRTDYEFSNLPARVNPSYRPTLQFQFEQPLLQGFGVEMNQLRSAHPGSVLTPFSTASRTEGILLTRIRFDQQRAEFERQVHFMLLNVEVAYWNLYGQYWNLYSRESALRQAYEAWKINSAKFQAGRVSIADLSQARGQYELFRGQRIQALDQVLESERQLRGLLGLPIEDGQRVVPADTPNLAPYQPDWALSLQEALALRPELILAREDLKARQLDVRLAKDSLRPDLRFTATYDSNGIGTRLDGPKDDNALRNLSGNHFNNWTMGFRADIPLGWRDAYSSLHVSRLNLARSFVVLQDQEKKTAQYLAAQYRDLATNYAEIEAFRAQREAFAKQLQARFQELLAGRDTLDRLLEAQRFWADALSQEYQFIVRYNNALARFEFAKGTIMAHDNVVISEGQLPQCAQVRAVEHERERAKAIVLREREKPFTHPKWNTEKENIELPEPSSTSGTSLPSMMEKLPVLPKEADKPLAVPKLNEQTNKQEKMTVPAGVTTPVSGTPATMIFDVPPRQ